jgi:micrococcal nuclease
MRECQMDRVLPRLVALIALACASAAHAADFPGKVVGVSDGDTLTVLRADRTPVKVRLYGIDAPETGQDFGSRAKHAGSDLAFGKVVTVRPVDTDRYGRTVAEVILPDGRSLNREMVRQGMAWWFRKYAPADRDLSALEAEARAAHRGLWGQPNPTPPWDWRRGGAAPAVAGVVGNRNSRVYHRPNSPSVEWMSEKNRVAFGSEAETERAGYRRAGDFREADPDREENAERKTPSESGKLSRRSRRRVMTFCCPACGYLESYAERDGV